MKLYNAVSKRDVRFNQLHAPDGSRIQMRRVCASEGTEVPSDEIVRGYEVSKGQYVVVSDEEIEAARPQGTHQIAIEEFVDLSEIDPVVYDSSYHAAPERTAIRAYALLRDAMLDANRVGIGRFALRTRESVCAVRATPNGLIVSTLAYADEIVPTDSIPEIAELVVEATDKEQAMAVMLIDSMTEPLDLRSTATRTATPSSTSSSARPPARRSPRRPVGHRRGARRGHHGRPGGLPGRREGPRARQEGHEALQGHDRVARPRGRREGQGHDRRGRRADAQPVQPRQAALPRRVHEGPGHPLLRHGGPGDPAAPGRAAADADPLPQRRPGQGLLRQALPAAVPGLAAHGDVDRQEEEPYPAVVADDTATLVWLANLAAIELHVPLAQWPDWQHPTGAMFDLDPGPPAGVLEAGQTALHLRDLLGRLGLEAVVKTTGGKGLHVLVPLAGKDHMERVRAFSSAVAELMLREHPDDIVTVQTKKIRGGKMLVDWTQNHVTKTNVAAYSLRAKGDAPTVSTPLGWDELEAAVDGGDPAALVFGPTRRSRGVEEHGDLWADALGGDQHVPGGGRGRQQRVGQRRPADLLDRRLDRADLVGAVAARSSSARPAR